MGRGLPNVKDRLALQMVRPDLLRHRVPLPSVGRPRRRRGRGSSGPSAWSASVSPRRARSAIVASGRVRRCKGGGTSRVAVVSAGVAWTSPGIASWECDAALESRDRDRPSQTSAALLSNAARAARAATDESGAALSCHDWLATRSNIQTGTPANDRKQCRSGYIETPPSLPSRPPRERESVGPPTGAMDREARAPRSRGCSVIELYNTVRPHSAIGCMTPAAYAATLSRNGHRRHLESSATMPVATVALTRNSQPRIPTTLDEQRGHVSREVRRPAGTLCGTRAPAVCYRIHKLTYGRAWCKIPGDRRPRTGWKR